MKPSPLKRKSRLKKASKKEVRAKDLDRLCREVTFKRDGYKCLRCQSTKNLQWAHVHSRRFKTSRWSDWNVMTLCAACHFWWHDRPIDAADWYRSRFPVSYERLRAAFLVADRFSKKDMVPIKAGLEARLISMDGRVSTDGLPITEVSDGRD